MRTDSAPRWLGPTASWWEALRQAAIIFVAFAGLHVLMWALTLTPFEWANVLQAALLAAGIGLVGRAAPCIQTLLSMISSEQLRVTAAALCVTAVFIGMSGILQIGKPGGLRAFLESWPLWVGVFLPMGFVLAMVGASEGKADGRVVAK